MMQRLFSLLFPLKSSQIWLLQTICPGFPGKFSAESETSQSDWQHPGNSIYIFTPKNYHALNRPPPVAHIRRIFQISKGWRASARAVWQSAQSGKL